MKYYYQHKRHGGVMELNQKMEDENWKEITEEQYEREYSRNWKLAMSFWGIDLIYLLLFSAERWRIS